jgi:hypothetical protein
MRLTMTDPITAAARATADRLAADYGPGLAADVEARCTPWKEASGPASTSTPSPSAA